MPKPYFDKNPTLTAYIWRKATFPKKSKKSGRKNHGEVCHITVSRLNIAASSFCVYLFGLECLAVPARHFYFWFNSCLKTRRMASISKSFPFSKSWMP